MRYRETNHRATEAERILTEALASARTESQDPPTPFAVVKTQAEARARACAEKENVFMTAVVRPMKTHRSLSFGVSLAVAVFALVTLVPFEYQRIVGYDVSYAGIRVNTEWTPAQIASVLKAVGYEGVDVRLIAAADGNRCVISGLPSRHAVREADALMASAVGFDGEAVVTPLRETVSGSLYAQVKEELDMKTASWPTVFSKLDLKGMSDEEIKSELQKRLAASGCPDAEIRVRTIGTERAVSIKVGNEGDAKACLQMDALDLTDLNVKDPSKTDAEIIALVKERLVQQGITDAEVSVINDAEGERQVMIKQGKDCK